MRAALWLTGPAAAAILAGCAASNAANDQPLRPQHVSWATYQHSPDRNAVFQTYRIAHDWSYDAGDKINSGLALVGNTLLFTTFSHKLVAIDVRNGRQIWQAPVSNIAMSTPIVAGNMVYVGTGRNGLLDRNLMQKVRFYKKQVWGNPSGDEVVAFDLKTGARRWTYRTAGEDMPSAVYDRGRLIFANGDWHAYALRADNGQLLWSTDVGGASTMANALMAGDIAIVAVCGDVPNTTTVALDPVTGKILWRSQYGHCDGSPTYADGKIFVNDVLPGDSRLQKVTVVAALDAKTGKAVWSYHATPHGLWSIVGSDEVAVAGSYANGMYFQPAPLEDQLLAFDGKTGKIRWRFHTSGPVKMSPVIAGNRIYFGDTVGILYTLDANTGTLYELREFKTAFTTSPPIIAGNKILIATGTTVDAIPLSGRPQIKERVGWGVTAAASGAQASASPQ